MRLISTFDQAHADSQRGLVLARNEDRRFMNPNRLQKHMAAMPITEPYPAREIPRHITALFPSPKRRRWWHWLRALLPLILLVGASALADTIVTDIFGNVIGRFPWPRDKDVYVSVPTVSNPLLPMAPRTATPIPTPGPAR
jgi:hypothetical protein